MVKILYNPVQSLNILYPLHTDISIYILNTVLYTFPKVLKRRICITTSLAPDWIKHFLHKLIFIPFNFRESPTYSCCSNRLTDTCNSHDSFTGTQHSILYICKAKSFTPNSFSIQANSYTNSRATNFFLHTFYDISWFLYGRLNGPRWVVIDIFFTFGLM